MAIEKYLRHSPLQKERYDNKSFHSQGNRSKRQLGTPHPQSGSRGEANAGAQLTFSFGFSVEPHPTECCIHS